MSEPTNDAPCAGSDSRSRDKEEDRKAAALLRLKDASGGCAPGGGGAGAVARPRVGSMGDSGLSRLAEAMGSRPALSWAVVGGLVAIAYSGVHTAVQSYGEARRADRAKLFAGAPPAPSPAARRDQGSSLYYLAEANRGGLTEGQQPGGSSAEPGATPPASGAPEAQSALAQLTQAAAGAAGAGPGGGRKGLEKHPGLGEGSKAFAAAGGGAPASGAAGSGREAASPPGPGGRLEGFTSPAKARTTKTAAVNIGKGPSGPQNLQRLDRMERGMSASTKMRDLQQASGAQTGQWSSAPGAPGITGGGTSIGGQGAGGGSPDDPAFNPPTSGAGGPMPYSGPPGERPPDKPEPQPVEGINVSPWQYLVDIAQSALVLAAAIIAMIAIVAVFWKFPLTEGAFAPIMMKLMKLAAVLGGIALACGAVLMSQHGQETQGGIFLAGGALVTACALAAVMSPGYVVIYSAGILAVAAAAAAFIGSVMTDKVPGQEAELRREVGQPTYRARAPRRGGSSSRGHG